MKEENKKLKEINLVNNEKDEKLNMHMITITCYESVINFLQSLPKSNSFILIDVKKTQEGCVFGAEVDVKIISTKPNSLRILKEITISELPEHTFLITEDFFRFFKKNSKIDLEIRKKFRKKIVCTNIPPFIIKTCGV